MNRTTPAILIALLAFLLVGASVYVSMALFMGNDSSTRSPVHATVPKTVNGVTTSAPITTPATPSVSFTSNPPPSSFKKSSEDQDWVYYEGTATLTGKYSEPGPDNIGGEILCFYPDQKSGDLIPRHPGVDAWFCLNDQEATKKLFKIDDKKVLEGTTNCGLDAEATIQISHYQQTKIAGETWDYATLDKIVSAEPYKKDCLMEGVK